MRLFFIASLAIVLALPVDARVPVEDRSQPTANPNLQQRPVPAAAPSAQDLPPPSAASNSFNTLQMLREEVMELRGMIEQLSHEVRVLKQRQADDYMDLDRRIGTGRSAETRNDSEFTLTPSQGARPSPGLTNSATSGANPDYEVNQYSAAYNLLKNGKIPEATKALQQHINDFPNGQYTANAYYWLGEIYLLENKLSPAKSAFNTVIQNYPDHRKAPDATFKLGKVLHLMGDTAAAKTMLNKAVKDGGSAGKLAEKYLSDNF